METLMTDFHFLRPWWLVAIIPLTVLILLAIRAQRRQGQWHQVLPAHLAKLLIVESGATQKKQSGFALWLAALIATIAMAGPTWERIEQPLFKVKQAQIVIADMSLSMYATDLAPNRLTRAKFKIKDLINRLSEGETGLVAYAGDAFVISPMTQDVVNLNNLLPALNPQIMPVYGSDPTVAVERALELLSQTQYNQGQLYLVTDGMEPGDARAITQLVKNTKYTLNILGVGTAKGAPIKLPNGQLLKDDAGNIVIPKLQANILRNLASTLSGRYSNLTNDQSDIDYLTQTLAPDEIDDEARDKQFGDEWHEMGPYLVLLILPFALFAFRRGALAAIVGVIFLGQLAPQPAFATTPVSDKSAQLPSTQQVQEKLTQRTTESSWWNNLWQSKNQRGYDAYQAQDFEQALSDFNDPQWRGAAHYKNGNYEQALSAFEQDKAPKGLFNQANALAKMERIDDAIQRLESLINQQPDFPNAKENLEILKQMQQQQQQDQSGQGQGKDQNQQQQNGKDAQDGEQQDGDNQQSQEQSGDGQSQQSEQQEGDAQQSPQQNEQQSQQNAKDQDGKEQEQTQQQGQQQPLTDEEKAQQQQAQQAAQQKQQMFNEDNLTPEQLQRLNQLVKKIPDDPSLLLKNKMAVEARKRQYQRVTTKERKKW